MKKKFMSMLMIVMLITFGLTACGSGSSSPRPVPAPAPVQSQVIEVPFYIVNQTGAPIYELYLAGAGVNDWGYDLLGGVPLEYTSYYEGVLGIDKNNTVWDIATVDYYGQTTYYYNVDLSDCSTSGVTITLVYEADGNYYAYTE